MRTRAAAGQADQRRSRSARYALGGIMAGDLFLTATDVTSNAVASVRSAAVTTSQTKFRPLTEVAEID